VTRANRAFTYAEMLVVLTVILLISSVLMPRFDTMKRSRELRFFKIEMRNLASEARTRAIQSGDTVALGFDKTEKTLFSLQEGSNGQEQRVGTLAVPDWISATQFSADQRESQDDGWRVPFFPDGSSAGGGIEFEADGDTFSFAVHRGNGRPRVTVGELPDLSLDEWKAGGYEPRT
jgi:type II secretory pathway pseudopilin PulG